MAWDGRRLLIALLLLGPALRTPAQMVESKLKAKFSAKKITLKGTVAATGDWPVTLRVELLDAQDQTITAASDTLRAPDGPAPFQLELKATRGRKFEREELAQARVRYSLLRAKQTREEQTVALASICPNLTKKKRWWLW